jgi:hypothetical protein
MAKKGSGPGDEDADFAALDKNSDSIEGILPPLDDSVLHDIFARLDDFSVLDGILSAERTASLTSSGASMGCRIPPRDTRR